MLRGRLRRDRNNARNFGVISASTQEEPLCMLVI
jgi:hypothetical protein